jgi:hypothetical protein
LAPTGSELPHTLHSPTVCSWSVIFDIDIDIDVALDVAFTVALALAVV